MDDNEGCRCRGRGLRRGENLDDVGLDKGEMLSSDVDDEGDDGEEL
jgi:hypothetical protein